MVGLMGAVFWPNLRRLWLKTNPISGEPNWGHSIFVPLIGLYYLYINREELTRPRGRPVSRGRAAVGVWVQLQLVAIGVLCVAWAYFPMGIEGAARRWVIGAMGIWAALTAAIVGGEGEIADWLMRASSSWFGGYLMGWGVWFYAWGIWPGQNDFFKDIAMVVTLFGVVLALCGWDVMRVAWFAIAFLVCAIPWPQLTYSLVAMPLQQLAASAAVGVLRASGVEAVRTGTQIIIGEGDAVRRLNVAEACAGLKSLMTFVSVGAAVGFLSARPLWQKVTIALWAIPAAIACNVMRVAGQGLLDHYVSHQWSESFAHQFVGTLMLVPAFFLILLMGWVLDHLFIEEDDAQVRRIPVKDGGGVIERKGGQKEVASPMAAAAARLAAQPKIVRRKPPAEAAKPAEGGGA
jgi:exosortase